MTEKTTQTVVVQDRSGSMQTIRTDVEGGLAAFLEAQREIPGEVRASLYEFDTDYSIVYEDVPVAEVPRYTLVPGGMTALYDAIGRTVSRLKDQIKAQEIADRPDQVFLVIVTDGEENASREFGREQIKEMLTKVQRPFPADQDDRSQIHECGWTVVYVGANQDAVTEGARIGIDRGTSITFDPERSGQTYGTVGQMVTNSASGLRRAVFTEAERTETRIVPDVPEAS